MIGVTDLKMLILMGILCFGLVQAQLTCPAAGGTPVEVTVPTGTTKNFSVEINRSARQTVCILFRVSVSATSTANLSAFSQTSNSEDYRLVPVSRSYNRKKWENVAGYYAKKVKVRNCSRVKCSVQIGTSNEAQLPTGKYMLLAFSHSLKGKEPVARFLDQAAFGATKADLDAWTYPLDNKGMAQWAKKQMDATQVPPTLHREYFRSNADFSVIDANPAKAGVSATVAPAHPCDKYSRWRDYAFTGDDFGRKLFVTNWNGKLLMTVNDEPRTVVDTFQDTGNPPTYSGAGEYQFGYGAGEKINEKYYFNEGAGTTTKTMRIPEINLPDEIFTEFSDKIRTIELPDSFEEIPAQVAPMRYQWYAYFTHRMTARAWDTKQNECSALGDDFTKIIGIRTLADGTKKYYHYAGYAELKENTIENPLVDGGASAIPRKIRTCANVAMDFSNIDSCRLITDGTDVCRTSAHNLNDAVNHQLSKNTRVCGCSGEVSNNAAVAADKANVFHYHAAANGINYQNFFVQKGNVFFMASLNAADQLRQRVAWALSQILVVTPTQINDSDLITECFQHYQDIFVRNAFGNYRDVLKEVSYSPMMAEMLSFLESRSAAYVLYNEGRVSRPDENYAREVMQLFSIGVHELNPDGTLKKKNGVPISTYDNTDIQNFARAWTGFRRQFRRANYEGYYHSPNRIDYMPIDAERRDQFPKTDLYQGYIGDGYPLCKDLPVQQFLKKGAEFRLVGSFDVAEMHSEPENWSGNSNLVRFLLPDGSALKNKLCSSASGQCDYKPRVVLDENLTCHLGECSLDNLRIFQVNEGIHYEYIRPACVELSFEPATKLKKVADRFGQALCMRTDIHDGALSSCCDQGDKWANVYCDFTAERVSFDTSVKRCAARAATMCNQWRLRIKEQKCAFYNSWKKEYFGFHWTNMPCSIQARVTGDGSIALVHKPDMTVNQNYPNDDPHKVFERVNSTNINLFKVHWTNDAFPSVSSQCGNGCTVVSDGCLCDTDVKTVRVFRRRVPPLQLILSRLSIGSPDPQNDPRFQLMNERDAQIVVYHQKNKQGSVKKFGKNTVFGVMKNGKRTWLRNYKSMVKIGEFEFRNPPRFMSLTSPEPRDAHYETDAVLDNYFYHPNTPMFIATRLIQRFGISNPSPRYVTAVATAFRTGTYSKRNLGTNFGDGKYGNLEATVGAILLDREARAIVLDADPASGSLKEPLVKFISLMRTLQFETHPSANEVRMERLQEGIGQMAHASPSVFSFFLPEYKAPGQINEAGLTAPEAQVLNAPTIIGWLNGIYSLIDTGLGGCYGGYGGRSVSNCAIHNNNPSTYSHGRLKFSPSGSSAADVVDELALLMTGGRLHANSRTTIEAAYKSELDGSSQSDKEGAALRLAQKLVVTSPEYHSTNVFDHKGEVRPTPADPEPSQKDYKAIVFMNLHGGMDGFNMLIPHSDCGGKDMYANYGAARGFIRILKNTLLQIDATSSSQVCNKFGLHPKLPGIKELYDSKDLTFISNLGILQEPVDKTNWRKKHDRTALFAHNTQTEETAYVDIYDSVAGIGIGGRITDVLESDGFKTGVVSVAGSAPPITSKKTPLLVVNPAGYEEFSPIPWNPDVVPAVKDANSATTVGSSFYGDFWSNNLYRSLAENTLLFSKYKDAKLTAKFGSTFLGRQFASISKLMITKDDRGKDRDIFFLEKPGFDHHFDIELPLQNAFTEISNELKAFKQEMVAQSRWDDVVVVLVSEFGRTLMGNTGNGSDHAWGNNVFIAGGGLKGGEILGKYPEDLSNDSPDVFSPGIVIPTMSWESPWNAIAQWFGVKVADMGKVLPNMDKFTNLLKVEDVFK